MGVALVLVPAVLVVLIVVAVRSGGGGLLPGDAASHTWALLHRPAAAMLAARVLTGSGAGACPYLIAVIAGLAAASTCRGRVWRVFLAVGVLAMGQGVRFVIMEAVARPRPPRADWATYATGFSLPSGHSTSAALSAGLLCLAMLHRAPRLLNSIIGGLAQVWAVGVGLSRVYLGVHWASDVIAGWLLAITLLSLCTVTYRWARRRRQRHACGGGDGAG